MTAGVTAAMTEEVHVTTAEVTAVMIAVMTAVAREMTAEAESLSLLSLLTRM